MSARLAAEIAALSRLADFLGKQLLKEAGDAGELRAEVERLKKAVPPATGFQFADSSSGPATSYFDTLLQGQQISDIDNNPDLLKQGGDWNKES